MKPEHGNQQEQTKVASCEPQMSRKDFVALVVKRGAVAGAILAAPAVVDAFLAPPAVAMASVSSTGGESGASNNES